MRPRLPALATPTVADVPPVVFAGLAAVAVPPPPPQPATTTAMATTAAAAARAVRDFLRAIWAPFALGMSPLSGAAGASPIPPCRRPARDDPEPRIGPVRSPRGGFPTPGRPGRWHHRLMAGSVLIVDDDPAFRRLAVRLLTDAGLTVVGEADTAAAALAAARATRPDSVLVDVGLPDRDGRDLAAELTALEWAPRVLLTSAHADGGDAGAASAGATLPFVTKDLLPSAPLPALLGSPPPG